MRQARVIVASGAAVLLWSAVAAAQGDANRITVPFSDASRPGTVIVSLFSGSITVRASTDREVTVVSDGVQESRETSGKAAGLRRLGRPAGLSITEENNVITIGSGRIFGDGDDVEVQVPARTNLKLSTVNGDGVLVERIEGDIEVTSVNGGIKLTDVAGTVVAHATNGDVQVTIRQATPDKPMSFTSLNGDVDVTLPQSVKANLKLRSDQGEVYTDFDVQLQQQRPAAAPPKGAPPAAVAPGRPVAPLPPLPPVPPLPPLPPGASEAERAARDRQRQAFDRQRQALERQRRNRVEVDTSIYGTVNGGGPEFELRTFNGDVLLRRAK
jgi:hypothetical protein